MWISCTPTPAALCGGTAARSSRCTTPLQRKAGGDSKVSGAENELSLIIAQMNNQHHLTPDVTGFNKRELPAARCQVNTSRWFSSAHGRGVCPDTER